MKRSNKRNRRTLAHYWNGIRSSNLDVTSGRNLWAEVSQIIWPEAKG